MAKEYVRPEPTRIPRSRKTERLYRLEELAAEAFRSAALELASLRGDHSTDFYTKTLPQAIYDFLDHWDTRAAVLACEAFLAPLQAGLDPLCCEYKNCSHLCHEDDPCSNCIGRGDCQDGQQVQPGDPVPAKHHAKDADCDVDPSTDCCRSCGVLHGDPCPECSGRGFHRPACPLSDASVPA